MIALISISPSLHNFNFFNLQRKIAPPHIYHSFANINSQASHLRSLLNRSIPTTTQPNLSSATMQQDIPDVVNALYPAMLKNKTFHCFSKLPVELRHSIWDIYLETPQVVALETYDYETFVGDYTGKGGESEVSEWKDSRTGLRAAGPHSILLSVCQEARERTLKVQAMIRPQRFTSTQPSTPSGSLCPGIT